MNHSYSVKPAFFGDGVDGTPVAEARDAQFCQAPQSCLVVQRGGEDGACFGKERLALSGNLCLGPGGLLFPVEACALYAERHAITDELKEAQLFLGERPVFNAAHMEDAKEPVINDQRHTHERVDDLCEERRRELGARSIVHDKRPVGSGDPAGEAFANGE